MFKKAVSSFCSVESDYRRKETCHPLTKSSKYEPRIMLAVQLKKINEKKENTAGKTLHEGETKGRCKK